MYRYKLVIFDLDGTLLDTSVGIIEAVKYAIQTSGKNLPDRKELETYIGPPIQDSFAKTFKINGKELDNMALKFRNRYKDYELLKAMPYSNIYKICEKLIKQNCILAVATYKREDYALKLLKCFGFDKYMGIIQGADFDGKLSKADIIKKVIEVSGIKDYKEIVMIGDTIHDAKGAESLGIDFIAVTYGYGFKTADDVKNINIIGAAKTTEDIYKILTGVK